MWSPFPLAMMSNKLSLFGYMCIHDGLSMKDNDTLEICLSAPSLLSYSSSTFPQLNPQYTPKSFAERSLYLASTLLGGASPRLVRLANFSGICGKPCSLPCCVPLCPASPTDVRLDNGVFVSFHQCLWCEHHSMLVSPLSLGFFGCGCGNSHGRGGETPCILLEALPHPPPAYPERGWVCLPVRLVVVGPFNTEENSIPLLVGSLLACGNT